MPTTTRPNLGNIGQRTPWNRLHFLSVYFFSVYNRSTPLWKRKPRGFQFLEAAMPFFSRFFPVLILRVKRTRCRLRSFASNYCAPGFIKSGRSVHPFHSVQGPPKKTARQTAGVSKTLGVCVCVWMAGKIEGVGEAQHFTSPIATTKFGNNKVP